MARVLMCWELGGGLGHVTTLLPLAEALIAQGHRVAAAVKDLAVAGGTIGASGVRLMSAPRLVASEIMRDTVSYAHILHNAGWADERRLGSAFDRWCELYQQAQPDVVLLEHAPTALLAARGLGAQTALIGTGFACPPPLSPWPSLRFWEDRRLGVGELRERAERLRGDEEQLLHTVNRVLRGRARKALDRLSDIFAVDDAFLATVKELDHYPDRPNGRYSGNWSKSIGVAPEWPQGKGKRLFAYLRPFPGLPALLDEIGQLQAPALVVLPGHARLAAERFSHHGSMRFLDGPVRLDRICIEADAAVLHGTHGLTVAMAMAGKPTLHVPQYLEHTATAFAISSLGIGLTVRPDQPRQFAEKLNRLVADTYLAERAWAFGTQYAGFRASNVVDGLVARLRGLMGLSS